MNLKKGDYIIRNYNPRFLGSIIIGRVTKVKDYVLEVKALYSDWGNIKNTYTLNKNLPLSKTRKISQKEAEDISMSYLI